MKLHYRIIGRLSIALIFVLTVWAGLFYFALMDEVNDEVDDSLEDYSEVIITRKLAGEQLPSHNNGSNNQYYLQEVSETYADAHPHIAYADSTDNARAGNGIIYVGAVFADSLAEACVDEGHVLGISPYQPGTSFCYYWGSGWSKGGIPSMEAWCDYLSQYAQRLAQPLQVEIK